MIKYLDDNNFKQEILKSKGIKFIDFFANWCGPCIKFSKKLEEILKEDNYKIIYKIDVEKSKKVVKMLEIDTLPTMCIYKDGKLLEKVVGMKDKEKIIEIMNKYV